MTAIVGFKCPDGVVIAGDTEESYGNDKAYTHKVFPADRKGARLCVAGAGIGYLIDHANEQIVSKLDAGIADVKGFYPALADVMQDLYVNKFRHYPVRHRSELTVQLLVGVQFAKAESGWSRPALFECQSNLVTPIQRTKKCCILGSGELLKQAAIQINALGLTTALAEWASIYLIHEAKRRFGGVGGLTHTFVMKNDGKFSYNLGTNLPEKEHVLDLFPMVGNLLLLSLDPSVSDNRAKDFVDAVGRWVRDTRRELKKLEHEGDKAPHHSITINNRELEKTFRELRAFMRSKNEKSEGA